MWGLQLRTVSSSEFNNQIMAFQTGLFVTSQVACHYAKEIFGFTEVHEIRELNSFVDRNFYIRGSTIANASVQSNGTYDSEYVLKIYNAFNSKNEDVIDAENAALNLMREKGFPCPEIIKTKTGEFSVKVCLPRTEGSDEMEVCVVRMLTLVSGVELDTLELTSELFYKTGYFIGQASNALKDFSHPALKNRHSMWSILSFPSITNHLEQINNKEVLHIVSEVLESFGAYVSPHLPAFREGTVNGDINGENLLVSRSPTDASGYQITGFIDFAHIGESIIVNEIVIPMVFFMGRGFEASGHILAGYQSFLPLPSLEFRCLYYLVAARLCQLVVYATNIAQGKDCRNKAYISKAVGKYFSILKKLWACPKEEVEQIWRGCQALWERKEG